MIIKEFGRQDRPVVFLIHGGGLSWWSWKKVIELLKENFSIRAVIIDGHGEDSENDFVSIENTAAQILEYIKNNSIESIHGICGLSIGAQIVVELFSGHPALAENWLIESALVIPLGSVNKWIEPLISLAYPLIRYRWYAKLQAQALCINEEDFNQYFEDSKKMSLESLKAVTTSNGNYKLKFETLATTKQVMIFVGSKEPKIMIQSAKNLAQAIPNSQLTILGGYKHGQFSLQNPQAYAKTISSL